MHWWWRVRQRSRMERELDRELRFHVDQLVDDQVRAGVPEEEARRRARLELGGLDQVKEACRDARGTRWVHDLSQDLRFAARVLFKERALTTTAVIALALGIGVNNTLFSIVNALCIRGLPVAHADRLLFVAARGEADRDQPLTVVELESLRDGLRSVAGVAAYTSAPATLGDDTRARERVVRAFVSANVNALIGPQPMLGRDQGNASHHPASTVIASPWIIWAGRANEDGIRRKVTRRLRERNDRRPTVA